MSTELPLFRQAKKLARARKVFFRALVADALRRIITEEAPQRKFRLADCSTLGEVDGYWDTLAQFATSGRVQGPRIHDARIAALATFHAVDELWSADRDFNRFPALKVRYPLVQ